MCPVLPRPCWSLLCIDLAEIFSSLTVSAAQPAAALLCLGAVESERGMTELAASRYVALSEQPDNSPEELAAAAVGNDDWARAAVRSNAMTIPYGGSYGVGLFDGAGQLPTFTTV